MTNLVLGWLLAVASLQPAPASTGALKGRVLADGSNAPVAGARVMLMPAGRPMGPMGPPPQTTTDEDGTFAFARVTPGDYRLDIQKSGYVPFFFVSPGARPTMLPPLHVGAGAPTDAGVFHLQKGAVIAGRVLGANGEPLAEARVMALRRTSMAGTPRLMPVPGQGQQTNDIGEFRVAGLPPGEYIISASPRITMMFGRQGAQTATPVGAHTATATTYYPGSTDPDGALPITVAAGETVGGIQFTMQSSPAFTVSGIVVDDDGRPVGGAMVMLMSDPRTGAVFGPAGNARSGDDGRFEIVDVVPGSYRLNASVPITPNGGGGMISSFSTGRSADHPAAVAVTDTDVKGVRVVAHRPQ